MAREFNALVTFDDAHYMLANEGYNQIESNMPTGTECMTKAAVLFFLEVITSNLDPLASNQLVPYELLEPVPVVLAWRPIDPVCEDDGT